MKTIIYILHVIFMSLLLSCGSKEAVKIEKGQKKEKTVVVKNKEKSTELIKEKIKEDNEPKIKVLEQMGEKPNWIDSKYSIEVENDNKLIFFVGYSEHVNKDIAKSSATLNSRQAAAIAIDIIVNKQVNTVWKSLGRGEDETKERVISGLVAVSARKLDFSQVKLVSSWYRRLKKPKMTGKKFLGYTEPIYEYYAKFSINYELYQKKRDEYLKNLINETKSSREKRIYKKLLTKLQKLD